ncbi:MAG: HupE/UreJ family protein [Bacteroidales bacterium]|nr:HupE/UreJ family protein [Bacteroidales bacterium]
MFQIYLKLGMDHIADIHAYDHILFVAMLCAVYTFRQWKTVLILVTAFTVGHSVTLALATLHLMRVPSVWVEFLIPVTIFFTALGNIISDKPGSAPTKVKYAAAMFFGLIHGLGFSSYLRSLLGAHQSVAVPLLGFNIGVELGQLLIVLCMLTLTAVTVHLFRIKQRDWILFLSGAGAGVSFVMLLERLP